MKNNCIFCNIIIPEGDQVCSRREGVLKDYKPNRVKTKKIKKFISDDNFIQLTIDDVEVNNDRT